MNRIFWERMAILVLKWFAEHLFYYGSLAFITSHIFSFISQLRCPGQGVHLGLFFKYLLRLALSFTWVNISFLYYTDSFYPPKTSGESAGNLNDPNKEALAKTEVSLTLTNKFDVPGDENAEMDARTILLK